MVSRLFERQQIEHYKQKLKITVVIPKCKKKTHFFKYKKG